jgi:telomerase protein component 1
MEVFKADVRSSDRTIIADLKLRLLNVVCATLIHEPKYYSTADKDKTVVSSVVKDVAALDGEFILKVALYVRDDLNIRSTANFLVALAANNKHCQPFLKKYFSRIIRLPTDMLEVVTLFLQLPDKYMAGQAIPASLRKAILVKFPDFDVYQLAKYNKEKSQKKKKKKQKQKMQSLPQKKQQMNVGRRDTEFDTMEIDRPLNDSSKPTLITLKQLIRKVHISEPAEFVMGIVGKKYPTTPEAFKKSGLQGEFNPSLSGRRMKLPTPETWESLLSAKGNRHSTWEELLDHKKLPFMAMLRNLRNLIITGISPKHHEMVLARLTDEKSIANSRQLPWRFLSAYDAINVDLEKLMNDVLDNDGSGKKVIEVKVKGKKGKKMAETRTIKKRVIIPVHMPDLPLIARYRQSIDTAIRLSTLHNLTPIPGKTVVFCDVSGSMRCPCSSRGNMGSLQTVMDIAILLGLMLQDSCEDCDYQIFSSPKKKGEKCHLPIQLQPNTILDNIKRVRKEIPKLGGGTDFPYEYLQELMKKNIHLDTFIILSDMMIAPGHNEMLLHGNSISNILNAYRTKVNPNLLFVAIDLYGSGKSIVEIDNKSNPLNVLITGFSDNILRYIAERGNQKQLEYVENIDKTKKIGEPEEKKRKDQKGRRSEVKSNEGEEKGDPMEM